MPVRPENKHRYPSDWKAISLRIRTVRAAGRCECLGECGRGTHDGRCPNLNGGQAYGTGSKVVLTVAHLDHTPEHVDDSNLRAMCQGCHLHYDRDHHAETRARTRAAALTQAGQLALDIPMPQPAPETAPTYWENRGPRDWQPVHLVIRYGNSRGTAEPVFPLVVTKPYGPRNVAIRRADGHQRVIPVRTLRRQKPT
jgi:hypothetical protein